MSDVYSENNEPAADPCFMLVPVKFLAEELRPLLLDAPAAQVFRLLQGIDHLVRTAESWNVQVPIDMWRTIGNVIAQKTMREVGDVLERMETTPLAPGSRLPPTAAEVEYVRQQKAKLQNGTEVSNVS